MLKAVKSSFFTTLVKISWLNWIFVLRFELRLWVTAQFGGCVDLAEAYVHVLKTQRVAKLRYYVINHANANAFIAYLNLTNISDFNRFLKVDFLKSFFLTLGMTLMTRH